MKTIVLIVAFMIHTDVCFSQAQQSVVDAMRNLGASMVFNASGSINQKYVIDVISKVVATNNTLATYVNGRGDMGIVKCGNGLYYRNDAFSGVKYDVVNNTWIAWCKPFSFTAYGGIFNSRGSDVVGVTFAGSYGTVYTSSYEFNLGVKTNVWQMITIEHFNDGANKQKIYLNDMLKQGPISAANLSVPLTKIYIGTTPYSPGGQYFDGEIGLCAVFPRALSDAEVAYIYSISKVAYQ